MQNTDLRRLGNGDSLEQTAFCEDRAQSRATGGIDVDYLRVPDVYLLEERHQPEIQSRQYVVGVCRHITFAADDKFSQQRAVSEHPVGVLRRASAHIKHRNLICTEDVNQLTADTSCRLREGVALASLEIAGVFRAAGAVHAHAEVAVLRCGNLHGDGTHHTSLEEMLE